MAITNAEMLHLLTQQASTDALAELLNLRSFEDHLRRELARATRGSLPLSLALIDIDHFKRINDAHGHSVGDRVLAEVAQRMSKTAREHDVIARIGGEEFAWLLPGLPINCAFQAAERMREAIAAQPFGNALTVTISVGISQLQPGQSGHEFRAAADAELYAAKRAGRNRTMPAQP